MDNTLDSNSNLQHSLVRRPTVNIRNLKAHEVYEHIFSSPYIPPTTPTDLDLDRKMKEYFRTSIQPFLDDDDRKAKAQIRRLIISRRLSTWQSTPLNKVWKQVEICEKKLAAIKKTLATRRNSTSVRAIARKQLKILELRVDTQSQLLHHQIPTSTRSKSKSTAQPRNPETSPEHIPNTIACDKVLGDGDGDGMLKPEILLSSGTSSVNKKKTASKLVQMDLPEADTIEAVISKTCKLPQTKFEDDEPSTIAGKEFARSRNVDAITKVTAKFDIKESGAHEDEDINHSMIQAEAKLEDEHKLDSAILNNVVTKVTSPTEVLSKKSEKLESSSKIEPGNELKPDSLKSKESGKHVKGNKPTMTTESDKVWEVPEKFQISPVQKCETLESPKSPKDVKIKIHNVDLKTAKKLEESGKVLEVPEKSQIPPARKCETLEVSKIVKIRNLDLKTATKVGESNKVLKVPEKSQIPPARECATSESPENVKIQNLDSKIPKKVGESDNVFEVPEKSQILPAQKCETLEVPKIVKIQNVDPKIIKKVGASMNEADDIPKLRNKDELKHVKEMELDKDNSSDEDEDDEKQKDKYHKMRRKNGKIKKEFKGELRKKHHEEFLAKMKARENLPTTSGKASKKEDNPEVKADTKPKMVGKIKLLKQEKQDLIQLKCEPKAKWCNNDIIEKSRRTKDSEPKSKGKGNCQSTKKSENVETVTGIAKHEIQTSAKNNDKKVQDSTSATNQTKPNDTKNTQNEIRAFVQEALGTNKTSSDYKIEPSGPIKFISEGIEEEADMLQLQPSAKRQIHLSIIIEKSEPELIVVPVLNAEGKLEMHIKPSPTESSTCEKMYKTENSSSCPTEAKPTVTTGLTHERTLSKSNAASLNELNAHLSAVNSIKKCPSPWMKKTKMKGVNKSKKKGTPAKPWTVAADHGQLKSASVESGQKLEKEKEGVCENKKCLGIMEEESLMKLKPIPKGLASKKELAKLLKWGEEDSKNDRKPVVKRYAAICSCLNYKNSCSECKGSKKCTDAVVSSIESQKVLKGLKPSDVVLTLMLGNLLESCKGLPPFVDDDAFHLGNSVRGSKSKSRL